MYILYCVEFTSDSINNLYGIEKTNFNKCFTLEFKRKKKIQITVMEKRNSTLTTWDWPWVYTFSYSSIYFLSSYSLEVASCCKDFMNKEIS